MSNINLSRYKYAGFFIAIGTVVLLLPAFAIASSGRFEVAAERRILEIRSGIRDTLTPAGGRPEIDSWLSHDGRSVLSIQMGRLTIRPLESLAEVELLPVGSITPVVYKQSAAWSADDKAIYYWQRGEKAATGHLWRLNIASRKVELLIKNTGGILTRPSPSPDGKFIAFYRNSDLMLAGTEGKNERMVCNKCPAEYDLAWSPDSSKILFGSETYHNGIAYLNLLTVATGQVTPLAPWKGYLNSIVWPSWSSGPFLCVHVFNQASAYSRWSLLMHGEPPVNWEIWHLSLPQDERTQVTRQPVSYSDIHGAGPEPSTLVARRMAPRADQWDTLMGLMGSSRPRQEESATMMLTLRQ